LASTRGYEHRAASVILALGIDREELEELLWFFRREDPSRWNYSILALSSLALVLGLLLLAVNITRNRKRKIHLDGQAARAAELEATQALVPVQQELQAQDQKAGDVVVQWKDGTITSLFTESSEDPV
ncbi:Organic solute transporter subunit beta, partial [Merops nubicus]